MCWGSFVTTPVLAPLWAFASARRERRFVVFLVMVNGVFRSFFLDGAVAAQSLGKSLVASCGFLSVASQQPHVATREFLFRSTPGGANHRHVIRSGEPQP